MSNKDLPSNNQHQDQDLFNPELLEDLDVFDDECDDDTSIDIPNEEVIDDYVASHEADKTEPRHQTYVAIVGIVTIIAFVVAVSYICYQLYHV